MNSHLPSLGEFSLSCGLTAWDPDLRWDPERRPPGTASGFVIYPLFLFISPSSASAGWSCWVSDCTQMTGALWQSWVSCPRSFVSKMGIVIVDLSLRGMVGMSLMCLLKCVLTNLSLLLLLIWFFTGHWDKCMKTSGCITQSRLLTNSNWWQHPYWFLKHLFCPIISPAILLSSCCCSIAQSCPTLCNSKDCSTPCLPVFHHGPEFAQTHIHWVNDAIQPSHPLSPLSPSALNLSQHQGLFQIF